LISQYDHAFYLLILNMAVKLRHLELVKYLLNHSNTLLPPSEPHLNINLKDRNNECPVLISVGDLTLYTTDHYTTSIKIFKFLLDHGADSNLKGVHGEPLLSVVLSFKIYVAAQYLLKCPIKIEEGDIFESYQPLMKAIYANEFDQVQSILCHPTTIVNVYPSNNTVLNYHGYGFTSVILAYMLNHKEIFNVLLASSNINELDLYGYSLLHYAILREDRKMVKELLRRGARVNYQENKYGRGNSALDIAITIKNLDIFETLIQSDQLKVNKGNGQGEIPLMTAIKLENDRQEDKLKMIKRLIELGSDVNFCTGNGMTPLRYAIHCRSLPILQLLVENGAHFNIMVNNKFGSKKFILMEALETDDAAIIQYIMQYHEERSVSLIKDIRVIDLIELMDQKGHLELFEWLSPFPVISKVIQAIPYYNKLELLRRLVQDRKIDIDIRDENGDTLLANAIRVCNFKMAYYLIEQGADIYNVNNRGESIYDLSYQYSCQPKHDSYKIDNSRKIYRIIKKIMEQSE